MKAVTNDEFFWMTIEYYMKRTGIPINFGITVMLGFVVGCAIAGQTFYLFTIENLKQFGCLKAMGVSNGRLIGMVMLQAAVVGIIGYGLGIGGAALFGIVFGKLVTTRRRRRTTSAGRSWPCRAVRCSIIITVSAALMSLKKVLFLEAGVVFQLARCEFRMCGFESRPTDWVREVFR